MDIRDTFPGVFKDEKDEKTQIIHTKKYLVHPIAEKGPSNRYFLI